MAAPVAAVTNAAGQVTEAVTNAAGHVTEIITDTVQKGLEIAHLTSPQNVSALSSSAMQEMQDLATSYGKRKRYDEALKILDALLCQAEGCRKILPTIERAKYLLLNGEMECAQKACEKIEPQIESNLGLQEMKSKVEIIDEKILELASLFVEKKCFCSAIVLAKSRYKLFKSFCEGEKRLKKMELSAALLEEIAREMAAFGKRIRISKPYCLMEDIVDDMQKTDGVDIKMKVKHVAWVYKYFGFCCDEMMDYERAIEINKQGLNIMKSVYGHDAKKFKVFGHLYHNLGASFVNTNQLQEAKAAFSMAIDVYKTTTDWESGERKQELISFSTDCLEALIGKPSRAEGKQPRPEFFHPNPGGKNKNAHECCMTGKHLGTTKADKAERDECYYQSPRQCDTTTRSSAYNNKEREQPCQRRSCSEYNTASCGSNATEYGPCCYQKKRPAEKPKKTGLCCYETQRRQKRCEPKETDCCYQYAKRQRKPRREKTPRCCFDSARSSSSDVCEYYSN